VVMAARRPRRPTAPMTAAACCRRHRSRFVSRTDSVMESDQSDPRAWIAALRNSHERLADLVRPLTPAQLREQSYCRDWTNAQVLSHIGRGGEVPPPMLARAP